jgi:hypothetical protein
MYETIVMLRMGANRMGANRMGANIFDTIHKMTVSNECEAKEELLWNDAESDSSDIIVSVPNHTKGLNFSSKKPIQLCVYQIRRDGLYPFILFLLHKPAETKEYSFIDLALPDGVSIANKKIKYASIAHMKTLLDGGGLFYAGYYEAHDKNIIILRYDEPRAQIPAASTEYIWATTFELINKEQIMNSAVHKSVVAFFHKNSSFLILKTADQRQYESPMLGYATTAISEIEEMDIYREIVIPSMGKCYYLYADMPSIEKDEKNIMRIVFFAGKMILSTDKKMDTYDSILLRAENLYIIQNYNQHVVLSVLLAK